MDPKKYLQQAKDIDRRIKVKKKLIAKNYESLYGKAISFGGDGGHNCTGENGTEKAIIRVLDYEEQVNKEIESLIKTRIEIEQVVNKLANETHREILERRHLLYESWEEISKEMHYSEQHLHRLHGVALVRLREILEKNESKCD